MTKLISEEVRTDGRLAPLVSLDRTHVSNMIDQALKSHRFCEVERALIVQIVCDAFFASAPVAKESAIAL